jgi:hypothetical protein
VPLYFYILNPDLATRTLFLPFFIFAPSSPRHHFFAIPLPFFLLHDDKRTNEQTNERTNGNSRHVHLLLAITNFLPFASFLFLLTLDRLQQ